MAPWLAKLYAGARIQNPSLKPPKLYVGLAFIPAGKVRELGSEAIDTRAEYIGHADICHGFPQQKGEPLPPHLSKQRNERAKAMVRAANFVPDPNPRRPWWRPAKDLGG